MDRRAGKSSRRLIAGLVGRTGELAVLERLVDDVGRGRGGAALIEGPAGIGKTRLVEAALDLADGARVGVAFARADPRGAGRPFHLMLGIAAAFQDGDDAAADLARFLDDVSVRSDSGALGPPGSARVQVIEQLVAELEQRCRSPLIIAVEDLHWADEASLAALRVAVRLTTELPLLIVASARPEARREVDASLRRDLTRTGDLVRLSELSGDDVAALVAELADGRPGPNLTALASRVGGNPLLVTELVRGFDVDGMLVTRDGLVDVADDVDVPLLDAVTRRIRVAPDDVMEVLRPAAVLGSAFSVRELSLLVDRPAAALASPLEAARSAGLVVDDGDRLRFGHELLRDAVYAELSVPVRTALHHDAARMLAGLGAPPVAIATHAALGAAPGDSEAVGWLRAAADDIMTLAPESALLMLDDALALAGSDPEVRTAIQRARVESLLGAGRVQDAARLAEQLVAGLDPSPARVALRIRRASLLLLLDRAAEASVQMELAADEADDPGDRALALAHGALARMAVLDQKGAAVLARDAAALGEASGHAGARTLAASLLSRLTCLGHGYADGLSVGLIAVEAADSDPTGQAHDYVPWFWVGMIALDLDDADLVDVALRKGRRRADVGYSAWAHPLYCGLAASWHNRRGDLDDARAEAETGVSLALDTGSRPAQMWSESILALNAQLRGDIDERDRWVRAAGESWERGNAALGIDYLAVAQALAMDDRAACEHLGAAWDLFEATGMRNCQPVLAVPLARVAASHDPDRADAVATEVRRAADRTGLTGLGAVARHVEGLVSADVGALRQAATLYDACGRRLERAMCRADAARLAAARDAALAARLRDEAGADLRARGAHGAAADLEADLAADGVAPAPRGRAAVGWDSLTRTERNIVALVGEGLTNSEIAGRRHVSRRTVETHLVHVYTKLGYSSRVRLGVEAVERLGLAGDRD